MSSPDPGLPSSLEKRQFTIKSCLGRGGFGEVYRASMANATGLENEVAVKLLHHDLDHDDQAVQRLRDEGRMLGALVHPSILRIHDFVVLDGRVGLVMEYVEGQDLAKCIRGENTMPVRALVEVMGRVADALRAAWSTPAPNSASPLHLIHRDIKPQNIRIGTQGDVKLLDFGVARSANVGREAQTGTGHMVGSYLYMAPECLLENTFGRESDIFALGATMYESLAHERLFQDLSLRELYVMVLQEDAYQDHIESKIEKMAAPDVVRIMVKRMLSLAPANRPSAEEISHICDDLGDALPGPSLRRWCKNRRWPPANEVAGILDGRTITEATMAAGLMPDLPEYASPRRRWDWGFVVGTMGTLAMLVGIGVAAAGLLVAFVAVSTGPTGVVTTHSLQPPLPEIPHDSAFLKPSRIEGAAEVKRVKRPPPAPPTSSRSSRVTLNLDADFEIRMTRGNRTFRNLDRVAPGEYLLQVDWGGGYDSLRTVKVRAGMASLTVDCNGFKRTCDVK